MGMLEFVVASARAARRPPGRRHPQLLPDFRLACMDAAQLRRRGHQRRAEQTMRETRAKVIEVIVRRRGAEAFLRHGPAVMAVLNATERREMNAG